MTLYRHVTNKEELVDAIIDLVFEEIGCTALWRPGLEFSPAETSGPM